MKIFIADFCNDCGAERHAVSRWIKKLQNKKHFVKKSLGYGFSEMEAKKICELLSMDFDKIIEGKNNEKEKK